MARITFPHGGRRPGWPPGRSGHPAPGPLAADEVALAVLWAVVLAGLLFLAAVALSTIFGWGLGTASTAAAAELEVPSTGPAPEPGSDITQFPSALAPDTTVTEAPIADISPSVGVTLGTMLESHLHSDILNMDLPYRVYLPPGYDGIKRFPVLYLLHGNGPAVYAEWSSDVMIGVTADAVIAAGKAQPMIIVMPDGEHTYFMNHYDDGQRWQDYFLEEVIPFVDANFRTIPDRAHRAVGGLSMGGTAALAMAFTRPDLFTAVGAHSPSLHWSSEGGPSYFGPDSYFAQYNPLEIAKTAGGLDSLDIWVDFGADDPWMAAAQSLAETFIARGIPHDWNVFPGNHFTTYWINHSPDYLEFYSAAFPTTRPITTGPLSRVAD